MTNLIYTLAALAAVVLAGGVQGQETCQLQVKELVAGLQSRYEQTRSWQAAFLQETRFATVGRTEKLRGRVYFQKPGKMRWEYQGENGRLIVADGKVLWLYDPADRQVVKIRLAAAFASAAPYALLSGVGNIARDFELELVPGGCGREAVKLKLEPREAGGGNGIFLSVNPDSFDILGIETRDVVGNVTRITFERIKTGGEVAGRLFHFDPPPGVDVVIPPGS